MLVELLPILVGVLPILVEVLPILVGVNYVLIAITCTDSGTVGRDINILLGGKLNYMLLAGRSFH